MIQYYLTLADISFNCFFPFVFDLSNGKVIEYYKVGKMKANDVSCYLSYSYASVCFASVEKKCATKITHKKTTRTKYPTRLSEIAEVYG